jgi:hypothetical protein
MWAMFGPANSPRASSLKTVIASLPDVAGHAADDAEAHQELDPASPGRIGLVDSPAAQDEDAQTELSVREPTTSGAGGCRVAGGDRRRLPEHRRGPPARLLNAAGEAEIEVGHCAVAAATSA